MKDFEKAKKSKHIAEIMDSMKSVTAKEGYIRNLRYLLMFLLWHTKIFLNNVLFELCNQCLRIKVDKLETFSILYFN